jgi:hypothetical protein
LGVDVRALGTSARGEKLRAACRGVGQDDLVSSSGPPLAMPPAIRDHLHELIRLRWTGRDPEAVLAALPDRMPEGIVQRLASGGPFGWCIFARLDDLDGRLALEVLEDDRMSGPGHYRIWDDGTREALPNERTAYSYRTGASAEEIELAQQAFYAHNRAVQAHLRERGFLA